MKRKVLTIGLFSALFIAGCSNSTANSNKDEIENEAINNEPSIELNEIENETNEDADTMENEAVNAEVSAHSLPADTYQKDDQGEAVTAIQQTLIEIGYEIEASGTFDMYTVWALTDIQLQTDGLHATGLYDENTKEVIEEIMTDEKTVDPGSQMAKPSEANATSQTIENPYEIMAVVNKTFSLPENYEPLDLTVPDVRFPFEEDDPKKQLRAVAAEGLEELFADAEKDGIFLFGLSGYRSYDRQVAIFASNVERHGEDHANTYSARAGESEHQTGLVMDVTTESVGFDLVTDLGEKQEGIWLAENAHKHGFTIRYPKGKEDITKYQYEPWHLRYVGEKAATAMYENKQTLEEYLNILP